MTPRDADAPGWQTSWPRPRLAIDLLVSVGRRAGSFIVVSMDDAAGAQIFAHGRDGRFHRRATTPSFAAAVQERGCGEALSSTLR
jgi:hypothetical protein